MQPAHVFPHIGIDGCQAGWFYVELGAGKWHYGLLRTFDELPHTLLEPRQILIDIPIGFISAGEPRAADTLARKVLKGRKSSVFPTPCRAALYTADYASANQRNRELTGRGLSKQSWHLTPKMRAVDQFLQANPEYISLLQESHPEIAFMALNQGHPLQHNKKKKAGLAERLAVLTRWMWDAEELYQAALATFWRRELARDDILDALALALVAQEWGRQLVSLPDPAPLDEKSLPMHILVPPIVLTQD